MLIYLAAALFAVIAAAVAVPLVRRRQLYARLGQKLAVLAGVPPEGLAAISVSPTPDFSARLATIDNFLPAATLAAVTAEAERLAAPERSYIPTHKKGGTVAYETVIGQAPALAALYQSAEMRGFVSRLTGVPVVPTPIQDQSSLSVLVYEKPGDHIGWHYDLNFYRGRHFTVLLPVVNRGSAASGLSHALLTAALPSGDLDITTPPNKLVVFEGAKVKHKVAPVIEGERRMVISMTYCADPRERWWQGVARRVKDTAFFGVRALWT